MNLNVRRSWHRGNYELIERSLSDVDWDFEFFGLSLDEMVSRLSSVLEPLVAMHVPIHDYWSLKSKYRAPRHLKNERQLAWTHYKRIRRKLGRLSPVATVALRHFQEVNYSYRGFYIRSVESYEQSLVEDRTHNSKLFHKYIRSKKVGNPSVGPLRTGTRFTSDCLEMAEILADGFSSVYLTQDVLDAYPHQSVGASGSTIGVVEISIDSVKRVLSALDVKSSMGPDGIHPCILKNCLSLAVPMYRIFTKSMREGIVPSQWKFSDIVPLCKKGSRSEPLNYRPISLTSVCCKSLERIIASSLVEFLETNQLLSEDQFGFQKKSIC